MPGAGAPPVGVKARGVHHLASTPSPSVSTESPLRYLNQGGGDRRKLPAMESVLQQRPEPSSTSAQRPGSDLLQVERMVLQRSPMK